MTYDAHRDRVVLFGGRGPDGGSLLNDTWEWDGTTWTRVQTAHAPSPRESPVLAYEPVQERVFLFSGLQPLPPGVDGGGWGTKQRLGDTWQYTGVDWVQLVPQAPEIVRFDQRDSMAFDPNAGTLASVGRATFARWSTDHWRPVHNNASSEEDTTMVYQAGVLLIGSQVNTTNLLQCDEYSCYSRTAPSFPAPRRRFAAVAAGERFGVVLVGGRTTQYADDDSNFDLSDVWIWDSDLGWSSRNLGASPPPRSKAAMTYDSRRNQFVFFGGYNAYGRYYLGDTWIIRSP